jgi:hypothetical protein
LAIKRLTIEIDDAVDQQTATSAPASLSPKKKAPQEPNQVTDLANYEETEETGASKHRQKIRPTTGRTYPDLVMECINSPRAMSTILVFISVVVFVGKIKSLSDLKYPAVVGIGLNVVWFSIPLIGRFIKWLKRGQDRS